MLASQSSARKFAASASEAAGTEVGSASSTSANALSAAWALVSVERLVFRMYVALGSRTSEARPVGFPDVGSGEYRRWRTAQSPAATCACACWRSDAPTSSAPSTTYVFETDAAGPSVAGSDTVSFTSVAHA